MQIKLIVIVGVLTIHITKGALLLWSNKKFEVSPLKELDEKSIDLLVEQLGYPEMSIYKSTLSLLPAFQELVKGYHTSYSPNGEINTDNATDISSQYDLQQIYTKQHLESARGATVLSVLTVSSDRIKREATNITEPAAPVKAPSGPVLYKGELKDAFCLLYSSKPLLLKTSNSSIYLGASDMVTVDASSASNIKLNVKIPIEDNIISLRFFFTSQGGYWSLTSVKTSDNKGSYSFNLTIESLVQARLHFSYHCNGETTFSDASKTTELCLYDLQVQIDAKKAKFDDAYDCVDFTTAPIWSGLFVTALMGVMLTIGLIAIMDIKTMDKFDNAKTKQLAITIID